MTGLVLQSKRSRHNLSILTMVAVALSAEVRPLPMVQPPEEEVGQISGTTPVTTTGIDSVDDHIARLKANARQHVDRELSGSRAGKTRGFGTLLP